jgi:UDP-galactopyranose mutase
MFDYMIVGAGFAGSVLAERLASQLDARVLVIDKRPHIAGNAYDFYDDNGILVHRYGPHIFHCNSPEIYAYLSQFTEWRPYQHRVLASVDGQLLPIPINLDTVNRLYGLQLTSDEMPSWLERVAEPRARIETSEDVVVSKVGVDLYQKFFRGYTRKQWGLDPSELDAQVTARIPTRTNRDDRYFTDTYQAMMLNTDYRDVKDLIPFREMIYTGPVDAFFDYRFGHLPYRSLDFRFETHNVERYQEVGTINFPNDYAYTRVTEFKHLTGQKHDQTTIVYEYPKAEGDPYYPIPRTENQERYKLYASLAERTGNVHFVGRLATYRYYNMDQVVAQALTVFRNMAAKRESLPHSISSNGKASVA